MSSPVLAANLDMRPMAKYVPHLGIYNMCQLIHAGRKKLQDEAAELIIPRKPNIVLDAGPSDGSFSTYFLYKTLLNSKIICADIDPGAIDELRKKYGFDPRVKILDPIPLEELAKRFQEFELHKKIDLAYFGGMWTDIAQTTTERIPTLQRIQEDGLSKNGIGIWDEELRAGNISNRVASLWEHHGRIIFNAMEGYVKHRKLAEDKFPLKKNIEEFNLDEFAEMVNKKDSSNDKELHAVIATAYYHLITQELYAFASGVHSYGDHKSTLEELTNEMKSAGFNTLTNKRIWPANGDLIVVQNSENIVNSVSSGNIQALNGGWDKCSYLVIENTLKILNKNRLCDDPHFIKAQKALYDLSEILCSTHGKPFQENGIDLTPTHNIDFGVHKFVAYKGE